MHQEITAQGFTGSYPIVRRFIQQRRHRPDLRATPRPLPPRPVTSWICRHPDNVTEHDTRRLHEILDRCPELRAAAGLVRGFGEVVQRDAEAVIKIIAVNAFDKVTDHVKRCGNRVDEDSGHQLVTDNLPTRVRILALFTKLVRVSGRPRRPKRIRDIG